MFRSVELVAHKTNL